MKFPTLLGVCACAMLIAGSAAAHQSDKPHKHRTHKAHVAKPVPPKDPYAAYWNDPGRAAPPFSYRGNGI